MRLVQTILFLNLLVFSICEESKVRRLGRSKNFFIRYIKNIHEKLYSKYDCSMTVDQLLPDTEDVVFRNHIQTLLQMKNENVSCSQTEIEPQVIAKITIKNKLKTKKQL